MVYDAQKMSSYIAQHNSVYVRLELMGEDAAISMIQKDAMLVACIELEFSFSSTSAVLRTDEV